MRTLLHIANLGKRGGAHRAFCCSVGPLVARYHRNPTRAYSTYDKIEYVAVGIPRWSDRTATVLNVYRRDIYETKDQGPLPSVTGEAGLNTDGGNDA